MKNDKKKKKSQENKLRKNKNSMEEMLYHADNVLYHKDILTKRIEDIDDRNQMETQDATKLLEDLDQYIEQEAKNSKEFYERQMKSAPVFDDSFKDSIMAEIREKALAYADEKKTTVEVEEELARIKDAFARLRDEAIGDQSLGEAIEVGGESRGWPLGKVFEHRSLFPEEVLLHFFFFALRTAGL